MPQMAPISWLSLFIMFSVALIFFSILNYFSFMYNPSQKKNNKNFVTNNLNWKW